MFHKILPNSMTKITSRHLSMYGYEMKRVRKTLVIFIISSCTAESLASSFWCCQGFFWQLSDTKAAIDNITQTFTKCQDTMHWSASAARKTLFTRHDLENVCNTLNQFFTIAKPRTFARSAFYPWCWSIFRAFYDPLCCDKRMYLFCYLGASSCISLLLESNVLHSV